MAEVVRENPHRDTVVVSDRDSDEPRSSGAMIAIAIIAAIVILFLLIGRPFGRGGTNTDTNTNVPTENIPTTDLRE